MSNRKHRLATANSCNGRTALAAAAAAAVATIAIEIAAAEKAATSTAGSISNIHLGIKLGIKFSNQLIIFRVKRLKDSTYPAATEKVTDTSSKNTIFSVHLTN